MRFLDDLDEEEVEERGLWDVYRVMHILSSIEIVNDKVAQEEELRYACAVGMFELEEILADLNERRERRGSIESNLGFLDRT